MGSPGSTTLMCFDTKIVGNTCYENYDDGIHTQRTQRSIITGNLCYGHQITGGSVDSSGIDTLGDENALVANNTCWGNVRGLELGNTASSGIGDTGCLYEGNVSHSNRDYGVTIVGMVSGILFQGNTIRDNGINGVRLGTATTGLTINDVTLLNNDIRNNGVYGIDLFGAVNRCTIRNNVLSGHTTRDIHVRVSTFTPDAITIESNRLLSGGTAPIITAGGTNLRYRLNQGYETENKGAVTLASGATTTVNHGLGAAPTAVLLTPTITQTLWVTNITATSFVVNRASATTTPIVYWRAEV